jgi:hypothetical protein
MRLKIEEIDIPAWQLQKTDNCCSSKHHEFHLRIK